ncbi:MAG: MFS transporter [Parcubacteria group bacterium]|nr:MFS transporter [Parcubacteria group bacterium]
MRLSIKDFKGVSFSQNTRTLYLNRLLMQVAFGVVSIFMPIFFYQEFGGSFAMVALIYALIYLGHMFLAPVGAMLFKYISLRMSMLIGVPFALFSLLSLAFWSVNPWTFLALHIFFIVIYKVLYWVPYHVDFSLFSDKNARGRQLSVLLNLSSLVAVITPIVGGFFIAKYGFDASFVLAAFFFTLSIPPLFFIPAIREKYEFGYFETFKKLFSKKQRPLFLGYAGDGAQSTVTAVVWPIFIFLIFDGGLTTVGLVTGATFAAIIFIRFLVGDLFDRWSHKKVLTTGSIIIMSGWLIKVFVETAFQVFLVDTYHSVGRAVNRLSLNANMYDHSADNGHYVDEFTTLREMALGVGRILMLALAALFVAFLTIKAAFIAAAFSALLVTLLNRQIHVE